jgi:hypothetical protein
MAGSSATRKGLIVTTPVAAPSIYKPVDAGEGNFVPPNEKRSADSRVFEREHRCAGRMELQHFVMEKICAEIMIESQTLVGVIECTGRDRDSRQGRRKFGRI